MSSPKTPQKRKPAGKKRTARDIKPTSATGFTKGKKVVLKHKKANKKGGRPPAIDEAAVRKLEAAFTNDFTIEEALDYADVKRSTYYDAMKKLQRFSDRMRRAQSYPLTLAKRSLIAQIKGTAEKAGDGQLSLRFLERRQPERYRPRIDPEDIALPNVTVVLPAGAKEHPRFKRKK